MSGPWENYASSEAAGPWTKYESSGGGVQDYEPIATRHIGTTELPQDEFAGRVVTRIRNTATGIGGIPRALADAVRYGTEALGLPPQVANAVNYSNPITAIGQHMPSSQEMNRFVSPVLPTVNAQTLPGKLVDTGAESVLGGLVLGGGVSSIVPSFIGGLSSETAGQAFKGTKAEPAARILGGVVGGGVSAVGQNALQSGVQAARNLSPNVENTASKILARNLTRDKMTPDELIAAQADLGPGTPLVEAGGPNVRGMVRGAVAAPGEARTTTQELFDARRAELPERASNALNKAVTPNASLGSTLDELSAIQSQQSRPAYQAAGIPERPQFRAFSINEPPQWNTPIVSTPALEELYKKSDDIKAAINAVRRLPDYKDVPYNSMTMWDKAYKRLGDMEQAARDQVTGRATTESTDIGNLRTTFRNALIDANPAYADALAAYSGPAALKDAAKQGRDWFTKKVDPAVVAREFQDMSPDQQQAALIGARDWARTAIDETRTGIPSDKVFGSVANQQRWEAITGSGEFNALKKSMDDIKNTANTISDIRIGSRTAPMLAEAADNNALSQNAAAISDFFWGHPVAGTFNLLKNFGGRLAEGRTEAVNARLAEIARMTDPQQVGLVAAMANKAALEEAARSASRGNALLYGTAAPTVNAIGASGGRR